MVDLRWDGDDFRNPKDSSGSVADEISRSGILQQGYQHGSLTNSLALYYPMKAGSGTTLQDETALEEDGSINGASWTSGKIGDHSIDFNGSGDYISRSGFSGISRAEEATIAFWVQVDGSNTYSFISQYDNTPKKFFVDNDVGSNYVRTGFYDVNSNGSNQVTTGTKMQTGTWYHVVSVYRRGETLLYLNGNQEGSSYTSNFGPLGGQDTPLRIGSWDQRRFHEGKMDDIRIYRRALSSPEIRALYNLSNPSTVSAGDTLQ